MQSRRTGCLSSTLLMPWFILAACCCGHASPTNGRTQGGAQMVIAKNHDGATRLVIGEGVIASTNGDSTTLTRRDGSNPVHVRGMLAGIGDDGSAFVVRLDSWTIAVVRVSSSGDETTYPWHELGTPLPTAEDDGEFMAPPPRWRMTGAVLTGAPETVVVAVKRWDVHETRLIAFTTKGDLLFEQVRLGSRENYVLRGLAGSPVAPEIAVAIPREADKPELARPSAILLLDARTGNELWRAELDDSRWGGFDGQVAIDGQGHVVAVAASKLYRLARRTGAVLVSKNAPATLLEALSVAPDGASAVAFSRTHRPHSLTPEWCYQVTLSLTDADHEFLSNGEECSVSTVAFDDTGKLWGTKP